MLFIVGCLLCFYLLVKGAEIYLQALAQDSAQQPKALQISMLVMFACFVAAAGFLFWLNYQSTHARDVPAAVFGADR